MLFRSHNRSASDFSQGKVINIPSGKRRICHRCLSDADGLLHGVYGKEEAHLRIIVGIDKKRKSLKTGRFKLKNKGL